MTQEVRAVGALAMLYVIRMLGLFMILPVLFVYGEHYQSATPALLGFALGVYGLSQALLQIPLGLLSDLIGRKPVLIIGLALFALGSLIAAYSDSIWGLVLGRALQGSGAIASTVMALVADVTSDENRSKAMAAIGASIGMSFLLAMVLGPVVAGVGGLYAIFLLSAVLSGLGVLLVLFVIPNVRATSSRDSKAIPSLLKKSLFRVDLLRLNFGIFTLHAVMTAMFVAVPVMIINVLDLQVEQHWKLYLPLMLGSFIVAVYIMMRAERAGYAKPALLAAVLLMSFSLLGLGFGASLALIFILALFVFFVAFNLLEAMLPSLASKLSPAGGRGTAMGLYSSSQFLGAFCGGSLGGVVMAAAGSEYVFTLCALMCLLWLLVAWAMPIPKSSQNMTYSVNAQVLDLDLQAFVGVEDTVYISEESKLYLKVDMTILDSAALESELAPYAVE
ncbi:MFS transporter [Agaribacterium sp. ZY112]|uniref:MFS transporter n=1 Tax=Agaribacterium sp. ZY112 TaxID=3233574 RepID=UPI0035239AB5